MADPPQSSDENLDLAELSLTSLAYLCRQATNRFFQHLEYDDIYCFELFYRGIIRKDAHAWEIILEQYHNLVLSWVQRHPSFYAVDEEKEYFVNHAFLNFWRAFHRDPEKFAKFKNLKSLLQYLKLCTNTAVQEYAERQMRPHHMTIYERSINSVPETENAIDKFEENLAANTVWKLIQTLLKTDKELIVAEMSFIYDMKPQSIYQNHQDVFKSVQEVRRVKGNLVARLRRDKDLLRILQAVD